MKSASKFIKAGLEANESLIAKVGTRIFPLVATAGTDKWPFITHKHKSVGIDSPTKDDGSKCRQVTAEVSVVSRNALEAEELADLIYPSFLEWFQSDDNTFEEFDDLEFMSEDEDYFPDIDSCIVKITFGFTYEN